MTNADGSNGDRTNRPDLRRIGLHPDFWYPVARSKDLKPGKTAGVAFGGEPIVVVRTARGRVYALEDRCAHRQMPLHLGVVEDECLRCCYHAWVYDETGRVCQVPYLPKGTRIPPEARRVGTYPCREAYGLVFVFPGDRARAETVSFPRVPTFGLPGHHTIYFSRRVRCHYTFMHENLMDMNHQFLHRKLMGRIKPVLLSQHAGDDWVQAEYRFEHTGGKPMFGANFLMGRKEADPGRRHYDVMTIRVEYPYQVLTIRRPSDVEPTLHLWAAYVPVDRDQRTNHTFGLLTVKTPNVPGLVTVMHPAMKFFAERVFTEDRMAVEAEQRAYDEQGGDWNNEVFPLILDVREVLRRNGVPIGLPPSRPQHTDDAEFAAAEAPVTPELL